jgi:hypothetical protein
MPSGRPLYNPDGTMNMDVKTLMDGLMGITSSAAKWVKSGLKIVSNEKMEERMAICRGCELWDKDGFNGTGQCRQCGCASIAKLRMATSVCPVGKWGEEIPIDIMEKIN